MSLEEIAEYRSVKLRHGSSQLLYEDFKQEVMRLADLRLTMGWQDYKGGTLFFGKERPDRLLDIVDVEYKRDGKSWTAFGFRCGQALAHFLDPDGLRWIGNYANLLLSLSPYHEALAKKIGTYWTLVGTIAGKGGMQPHATIRSILEFCGEEPNMEKPGRTVEAIIEAHERLREIGVLEEIPDFEPPTRLRGFFQDWLDESRTVKLAESLWKLNQPVEKVRSLPASPPPPDRRGEPNERNLRVLPAPFRSTIVMNVPADTGELYNSPAKIQQFRAEYGLHQAELAQALGISRETLSRYERGVRKLPPEIAKKVLELWQSKASGWQD
jgi:DNA-binding XRE family transcriptional regulator